MTVRLDTSYLKKTSLAQLTNWSVHYLLETSFSYNEKFELAPIGSFLKRRRDIIHVEDEVEYQQVTVKIHGNGVEERDWKFGKNIGTKRQYRASAGQFIMSKIDARNGAFGIVPEELDGAMVTNDFPVFDIDTEKILPQFFVLLTSTKEFISFAQSCSSGTTNRQRIDLNMFLEQSVPLPEIDTQRRIINKYYSYIKKAELNKSKVISLKKEIESYLIKSLGVRINDVEHEISGLSFIKYSNLKKWSIKNSLREEKFQFHQGVYPTERIGNLTLFFEGGKTPSKSKKEFWENGEVAWCSPKDFKSPVLNFTEDAITQKAVEESNMKIYPKGTILSVFRSGILRHSFPTMITEIETTINQDIKAYDLNEKKILKEYYCHFISVFSEYILAESSKKGVTVESINTKEFLDIAIPIPPLSIQEEIAEYIESIISEIKRIEKETNEFFNKANKFFKESIFAD